MMERTISILSGICLLLSAVAPPSTDAFHLLGATRFSPPSQPTEQSSEIPRARPRRCRLASRPPRFAADERDNVKGGIDVAGAAGTDKSPRSAFETGAATAVDRRGALLRAATSFAFFFAGGSVSGVLVGGGDEGSAAAAAAYSGPTIDVNNAMAREFTAFPGLYPTIATKIVNGAKEKPFASKRDVYAVLTSDLEVERLKQYDEAIVISKPDAQLKQFKASQICKYECGSRTSNAYRDSQIKAVQAGRLGMD